MIGYDISRVKLMQKEERTSSSKLATDLRSQEVSLIEHMEIQGLIKKKKNALSSKSRQIMNKCFDQVKLMAKQGRINQFHNYFSMSLKQFFITICTKHTDLLDEICATYIYNWIEQSCIDEGLHSINSDNDYEDMESSEEEKENYDKSLMREKKDTEVTRTTTADCLSIKR